MPKRLRTVLRTAGVACLLTFPLFGSCGAPFEAAAQPALGELVGWVDATARLLGTHTGTQALGESWCGARWSPLRDRLDALLSGPQRAALSAMPAAVRAEQFSKAFPIEGAVGSACAALLWTRLDDEEFRTALSQMGDSSAFAVGASAEVIARNLTSPDRWQQLESRMEAILTSIAGETIAEVIAICSPVECDGAGARMFVRWFQRAGLEEGRPSQRPLHAGPVRILALARGALRHSCGDASALQLFRSVLEVQARGGSGQVGCLGLALEELEARAAAALIAELFSAGGVAAPAYRRVALVACIGRRAVPAAVRAEIMQFDAIAGDGPGSAALLMLALTHADMPAGDLEAAVDAVIATGEEFPRQVALELVLSKKDQGVGIDVGRLLRSMGRFSDRLYEGRRQRAMKIYGQ